MMASSEAIDGEFGGWVKVLRRGQKHTGKGKSVHISNFNNSVNGFNSSIKSSVSINSVRKSVEGGRARAPVGVKKYIPRSRREELS